ncbi:MAG TPA: PIN domain nuclease [Mycobacteriales bacterium]|nr:PIN domain nuclease [Mycobacteriales bacterium]
MIVDTSVWIDFFAGRDTWQVAVVSQELDDEQPVGLTDVVYTEILQGIRNDGDLLTVERQLLAMDILPLEGLDDFRAAALLYRAARRQGLTIRRTTDCLIAAVCIRTGRPLLHHDADFDRLAQVSALELVAAS